MHIEQTFAYQFQDLKIIRSKLCLICFLVREVEVDLAGDMVLFWIPGFQLVPSVNSLIFVENVRINLYEAQKCFMISAVIDVNADFRVFPKDITIGPY